MRNEFKYYWFPYLEKINPYGTTLDEHNYLVFRDNLNKQIIRCLDGKRIMIKSNAYNSRKFKFKLLNIYKKIYMRYLKENHYKELIDERIIGDEMNFYNTMIYCDGLLCDMIKLYIFEL